MSIVIFYREKAALTG